MDKKETVDSVVKYLNENYKDYILFITLVGSASHNAMYKGISDIDFMFITENIDLKKNTAIMKHIRENYKDFKIDTSFTPRTDIENQRCLNFKAMQGLYLVQKEIVRPLYIKEGFEFLLSEKIVKNAALVECLCDITEVRRIVSDFNNWPDKVNGQRKLLKTMYYAMKKFFILSDIFPKNVNDTLRIFQEKYNLVLDVDAESILRCRLTEQSDFKKLIDYCSVCAEQIIKELYYITYYDRETRDLRIKDYDVTFKARTGGIIKHEDSYLFVRMESVPYWCVPGGYIELNESSEEALKREVFEETGMQTNVKNLFLINENFYRNYLKRQFHEIGFYYNLELEKDSKVIKDGAILENDDGIVNHLEFKWFKKEEIQNIDVRPRLIKEIILNDKLNDFKHVIFRG